jgi:hypothetical protein
MAVLIWNTMGRVLHKCATVQEAEELIEECQYEELDRTYKNADTNIVVIED